VLLAVIHASMGLAWFAALILATRPIAHLMRRPRTVEVLERTTGLVFVGFGVKLALARR
jgi:threonine/homoserine/homoserine lactone efflux protein